MGVMSHGRIGYHVVLVGSLMSCNWFVAKDEINRLNEGVHLSQFCLFCGSCCGLCHTTLTRTSKVDNTCRHVYTKLHVGKAWKSSKWSPCTNVSTYCFLKSCSAWLCTSALYGHIHGHHPTMALSYFIVMEEEGATVVKCFGLGCGGQPTAKKEAPLSIPAF